jgi:hypothetical protein
LPVGVGYAPRPFPAHGEKSTRRRCFRFVGNRSMNAIAMAD